MKKYTAFLLLMFSFLSFLSCKQIDFSNLLNDKSLSRFYLSEDSNDILSLDIDTVESPLVQKSLTITVPRNTELTTLIPSFDLEGFALFQNGKRQTSGVSIPELELNRASDTGNAKYELYSFDGRKDEFLVTLQWARAYFTSFTFTQKDNPGFMKVSPQLPDISFDEAALTGNGIWFTLPHTLSFNGLKPSFTAVGESPPAVIILDEEGNESGEVTSASASYDFSTPKVFRVKASDGTYLDYKVSPYRLSSLSFSGDANKFGTSDIYEAYLKDGAISIQLPLTANLSSLIPDFAFLGDTITFNGKEITSGKTKVDFSSPVEVVVSTGTGMSRTYSVTVTKEAAPYNPPNDPIPPGADTIIPGPVTITAVSTGDGSVSVTWTNPLDTDFDHSTITVDGASPQTFYTGSGESSGHEFTGLSYADHLLSITAYDTTGNQSVPAVLTIPVSATAVTWILIYTADDLNNIRNDLTENYMIMNDINLIGTSFEDWDTIGSINSPFEGIITGNGHLLILQSFTGIIDYCGFIEKNDGTIMNLNIFVTNLTYMGNNTGIFTGMNTSIVKQCSVSGTINITRGTTVGGLVGTNRGTVTYCSSYTNITAELSTNVGGLVGYNNGSGASPKITYCFAAGSITGSTNVGGLVGYNMDNAEINNCYARGNVNGSTNIGGLLGQCLSATVDSCYAAASGDPSTNGGLIGTTSSSSITNSYFDIFYYLNYNGTPVSTAALKSVETYTNVTAPATPWDFPGIWTVDPAGIINGGYPYLTALPPQ